ncbi:MAG: hypothetical protein ABF294_07925 [Flavobacteriales bacterium]|jgi:amino acid transporter|tara:strand:- start:2909 stop:3163 length:255 start_codon:yes stop_codon:yes gene_type:complete
MKTIAIILSVIGIIILVVFLFYLNNHFDLMGFEKNMEATGQVGDFIGGLVGSIWSLVSFAILAAGGYIFYEMHQINKKRSEKLT